MLPAALEDELAANFLDLLPHASGTPAISTHFGVAPEPDDALLEDAPLARQLLRIFYFGENGPRQP